MSKIKLVGALLFLTPALTFGYCDPLSSGYSVCMMAKNERQIERSQQSLMDGHRQARQRFNQQYFREPSQDRRMFNSYEDVRNYHCALEGNRPAVCRR